MMWVAPVCFNLNKETGTEVKTQGHMASEWWDWIQTKAVMAPETVLLLNLLYLGSPVG